jgi:hypothetical protein
MLRSLLPAALLTVLLATAPPAQTTRAAITGPAPRSGAAMTYDATSKVVLLFGGSGARVFRDLWAWNGGAWERLANGGPAPREDAILAHDPLRRRTILFGGRGTGGILHADTWAWDGAAWTRLDVSGPGPRLHASGAFDLAAGGLRIHGGTAPDGRALADTWEWDGVKWRRVAERGPVAGRLVNRMVHDPVRRATLLSVFDPDARDADGTYPLELWRWSGGGWDVLAQLAPSVSPVQDMSALPGGGILLHDGGALQGSASTWTWRRGTWELAASLAADGPSPRNGHALASDPDRGRTVLFGGFRDGADLDDTWEFDGTRWRRLSPPARSDAATRPPARFAASTAFDSARGELLVHGGEDADGASSETRAWDGSRWRRAAAAVPSRRTWGSMAYDPLRARTVLFGGIGPDGVAGDTLEWDGAAWTRVASAGPAPRYAHELAYDPVRRRIVLFGGRDATSVMRDLWEWDGVRWSLVADDGPSPRFTHALAFDAARGELLAFAGHGPGGIGGTLEPLADLWLRDGGGWRASSATGPGPMDHVSAAFDAARGRTLVLNSGPWGGPRTWEWDGAAWEAFDAPADIVGGHRIAYDSRRDRVLLWTGDPTHATQSRVLVWNGTSWVQIDP